MKKLKWLMSAVLAGTLVTTLWYTMGHSRMDTQSRTRLHLRTPNTLEQKRIGVNNWRYEMRNDGSYFFDVAAGNFGGEFPRGSNYSGVFAAGIWVGALKTGVGGAMDTLNVAQVEFESEYLPGKVLIGTNKDQLYRGYVGNIDQYVGQAAANETAPLAELSRDDEDSDEYHVFIATQDGIDPSNWPSYAPRLDNGQPFIVPGTSAQTYTVFNDLSTELTDFPQFSPAPGFGIEVELESFAFTVGALSNGVFLKASITNKSTTDYPGAYLGIWSDMDVGSQSSEDLANVDTVRGVAMVYSQTGGSDVHPIAVGLDFLQGPLVKRGQVSDALFDRFFATPDSANLRAMKFDQTTGILRALSLKPDSEVTLSATAFTAYPNNTSGNCGQVGNTGDICRYNYLQGLTATGLAKPKGPYDPFVGVTPADQRVIHSVGPFVLTSGVTQDVWMGFAGGIGTEMGLGNGVPFDSVRSPSAASAVAAMYITDDAMQKSFNAGLAAPGLPDPPIVTATALPNKVLLTWTDRSEKTVDKYGDPQLLNIRQAAGYNVDYVRYDFQGYRVYKSLTALPDKFTRVAEFDIRDGITMVNDTASDLRITYDIQIGTDNGLQHYYEDEDVVDARTYYYSVTAYDYQPLFYNNLGQPADVPRSLENALTGATNLVGITPHRATAGNSLDASASLFTRTAGTGVPTVEATVLSPNLVLTKSYDVEFFTMPDSINGKPVAGGIAGKMFYRFIDTDADTIKKFDNYTDDPRTFLDSLGDGTLDLNNGDELLDDGYFSRSYFLKDLAGSRVTTSNPYPQPIVDGVLLSVTSDVSGVKDILEVANAAGTLATPVSVFGDTNSTGNYKVRIVSGSTPLADDADYTTAQAPLNPFGNVTKNDFEIRFVTNPSDSSVAYIGPPTGINSYETKTFVQAAHKVPFQIWNIGQTAGVASDDQRLSVKPVAQVPASNSLTVAQIFAWNNPVGGDSTYSERLVIVDTAYVDNQPSLGPINSSRVALSNILIKNVDGTKLPPEPGTVIRFVTYKPIQPGDRFVYSTVANTAFSSSKAKRDMGQVKVVPNPYYGRAFEYQRSLFDKQVKFINLPSHCVIRIFTVAGDLVRTLTHAGQSNNNRLNRDPLNTTADFSDPDAGTTAIEVWDLRNNSGTFVASGMYVAVVEPTGEAKDIKTQTVKFAVIQEAIQINGPDNR